MNCNGLSAQRWRLGASGPSGARTLVSVPDGFCLDAEAISSWEGRAPAVLGFRMRGQHQPGVELVLIHRREGWPVLTGRPPHRRRSRTRTGPPRPASEDDAMLVRVEGTGGDMAVHPQPAHLDRRPDVPQLRRSVHGDGHENCLVPLDGHGPHRGSVAVQDMAWPTRGGIPTGTPVRLVTGGGQMPSVVRPAHRADRTPVSRPEYRSSPWDVPAGSRWMTRTSIDEVAAISREPSEANDSALTLAPSGMVWTRSQVSVSHSTTSVSAAATHRPSGLQATAAARLVLAEGTDHLAPAWRPTARPCRRHRR